MLDNWIYKIKDHKSFITFFLIHSFLLLNSCSGFKQNKTPQSLVIRYSKNAAINYGASFDVKACVIFAHGKEKDMTGKEELDIKIEGAIYTRGKVRIENYPESLTPNVIKIWATYSKNETTLTAFEEIPFNYKSTVQVDFRGKNGATGNKGSNGSTPVLFRDGKDGDSGGTGNDGESGDNLTVYVWKDSIDFYFIKVTNLTNDKKYIYKIKDEGFGFRFDVTGGNGGNGGVGGDGGKGKDGSSTDSNNKRPGNGGRGGVGGTGGNGGSGGSVYIFIHPNAAEMQGKIIAYNFGGNGGIGGNGGKGGKAGAPAAGQSGTDGQEGAKGLNGYKGGQGTFTIIVEEFDIEY